MSLLTPSHASQLSAMRAVHARQQIPSVLLTGWQHEWAGPTVNKVNDLVLNVAAGLTMQHVFPGGVRERT